MITQNTFVENQSQLLNNIDLQKVNNNNIDEKK